ncbi:MAG: pentapeptide repeat-containing protein [Alphaproteobacteria bacterium]|nr:pentapeptide repeat-containing protein [Alphaproteobacteria bacterium]
MAISFGSLNSHSLAALGRAAFGLGGGDGAALDPLAQAFEAQKGALFAYKREALELAQKTAQERGDGSRPTMTDYFIASQTVGALHADAMANQGIQWTAKVIADLSGQRIEGFQINKADMEPPENLRMLATLRATETARTQGRKATLPDMLMALQDIQQSGERIPSIESLKDTMDLDGNHAISNFFADIDHHAKFEGTIFSNVSFHPAGTLMRDGESGVALTEDASFEQVTFDGMGADDTVKLAKGTYTDIAFSNIKGGTIEIADGTQVDGMNIRGAQASLRIGHASLSNLDATNAHIISLTAAKGAQISQATFVGATIDMASALEGSVWKNITFKDANLVDVGMKGATLQGVTFTNTNLKGLDLRGATLSNVMVDGKPIVSPSQLANLGVEVDEKTVASASRELLQNAQLAQIRATMQEAVASLNAPAIDLAAQVVAPLAAANPNDTLAGLARTQEMARVAEANNPPTRATAATSKAPPAIVFGGSADFNSITQSVAITSQPRTVPVAEQASGANMSRSAPPSGNTTA